MHATVVIYTHKHGESVTAFAREALAYEAASLKILLDCDEGRIDDEATVEKLRALAEEEKWDEVVEEANKWWQNVSEGDRYEIHTCSIEMKPDALIKKATGFSN